jgi:hypothetical protein
MTGPGVIVCPNTSPPDPDPWTARATHVVLNGLLHRGRLFRPDGSELVELPEREEPDVCADLRGVYISADRIQGRTPGTNRSACGGAGLLVKWSL